MNRFNVDGVTALVTGGSRGIGREIARQFHEEGADVAICSRDQERIDRVAGELNNETEGGPVLGVECDVRDPDAVESFVATTVETFGGLDVLVNNAGAVFDCPFDELSTNGWQTLLDINLTGAFYCTRAAAPHLESDGGSVINISSIQAREAAPGEIPYGAAKAGLENLTKSLAAEWAERDVRVNAVAPGFIATAGPHPVDADLADVDRSVVERSYGTPAEVADAVQFLASPAASFVSGEVLTVRGPPTPAPE